MTETQRLRKALEEIRATCRRKPRKDKNSDEYRAAYFESNLEIVLAIATQGLEKGK